MPKIRHRHAYDSQNPVVRVTARVQECFGGLENRSYVANGAFIGKSACFDFDFPIYSFRSKLEN